MSGALAVAVPEGRINELNTLEAEKAKRIWRVRGIVSDVIPLGGDIASGLSRRREHNFFLKDKQPLTIYLHRGGRDATYYDLFPDADGRLDYIEARVETNLPSNAFLHARQPLNEMLDALVRNPPHPPLVLQRLELLSPRDGGILAYEVTLPFMGGVLFGPLGGILQFPAFAPYYATFREAITASSPFYRLLCAWRVYEGIQVIRRWLREQCERLKINEKLPKDPEVDVAHLERMGYSPELCARIHRVADLFNEMSELRHGIAHFLFEGQAGGDGHIYLSSGQQVQTYSLSAAILLGYVGRAIDGLRLFYSQHLEAKLGRGMILPMLDYRDQFNVRGRDQG
ncbi:MAG: methylamine utilization protein MauJ [Candidatus Acidiferrum sp.]